MKVLVTGGAGFIGSNLCKRLLADEEVSRVAVVDNLSTGYASNLDGLDVDFFEGSILDKELLGEAARDASAIVHLAALGSVPRSIADPESSHAANASGTLQVLQAARTSGNAHVIVASSSSVYGSNAALPKVEGTTCMPMSPYAVSKLAGEQYAVAFANCYGLPVLPFRFFNVYGPSQRAGHAYAAVIPTFVDAALRGMPLQVNGDGSQSRDFTYVGTVVEIIRRALLGRTTGGPTNLGFGTRTSLLDLISVIESELGHAVEVEFRPPRSGDVPHSQASNLALRNLFPDPKIVPLEEGIRDTIAWMRGTLETHTKAQT